MGRFNLSHDHTTTFNMGELVPVSTMEVLPGDTFRVQSSALMRTTPLLSPVMHPVIMRLHHFFVPNRLVDEGWEDFITTKDGRDATGPTIAMSGSSPLLDYMGIRQNTNDTVMAHAIRGYNLIWNEWFRDQDLQDAVNEDSKAIQRVAWGRDYFTNARPSPQQGDAVTIPISGEGTVNLSNLYVDNNAPSGANVRAVNPDGTVDSASTTDTSALRVGRAGGSSGDNVDPMPSVAIDGSGSIDINTMRRALFLQEQAEDRARYGSRYVDLLRQLGQRPQDNRLQRPELLGGAQRPISFSEVVATAEGTNVEVGDLYGHGLGMISHRPLRRMFPEHGWYYTLMSVVPRTQYMNARPKQFSRLNPTDYWFPEGEIEGPQEILNKEIFSEGGSPDAVFGYTGRHDEYRSKISYISGEIRNALDSYTYARNFSSTPVLNASFISANPTDRVYSDDTVDQLRCFISHKITANRLVSQQPMV